MKESIYTTVTNQIIAELEKGSAPWVKPWKANTSNLDHNLITKKPYKGINRLILALSGARFTSRTWATYKQIQEQGGQVRKGEKATQIVFFKPVTKETRDANGAEKTESFAVMKSYSVFNLDQQDGIELTTPETHGSEFEDLHHVETFIANCDVSLAHGTDGAYYIPSRDTVCMPDKVSFLSESHYYATLLHEMTHWTGHKSRLDRDLQKGKFGDHHYAMEELTAELGAAFLCQGLGVEGDLRHADYIGSWLKVLKADNSAIFKASALAQKAVDYLDGLQVETQQLEALAA